LTELAEAQRLSVRSLSAQILQAHAQPVPHPPATEPSDLIRAAFHALYQEQP
jgi:hypothetical protein